MTRAIRYSFLCSALLLFVSPAGFGQALGKVSSTACLAGRSLDSISTEWHPRRVKRGPEAGQRKCAGSGGDILIEDRQDSLGSSQNGDAGRLRHARRRG